MELTNKEKAVALLKSLETGSTEALKYVNPKKYIQHNLAAPDGIDQFEAIMQMLPPNSTRIDVVRVFEDGDYVFTHSDVNFFGEKIAFDIFRFEDGLIVEHWDNLQDKPAGPNPAGRTMTDGPTTAVDLDRTAANKALIKDFYEKIFIGGQFDRIGDYFHDGLIQHNPRLPDGLTKGLEAFAEIAQAGYSLEVGPLRMILGEGNFVLTAGEGRVNGEPAVIYDLFRLEDGRIAERWDVIEPTLPRDQWQNSNGKF